MGTQRAVPEPTDCEKDYQETEDPGIFNDAVTIHACTTLASFGVPAKYLVLGVLPVECRPIVNFIQFYTVQVLLTYILVFKIIYGACL